MDEEVIDLSDNLEDLDLTGVDTALPILAPQITTARIVEAKKEPNSKGTGNNLNLKLELTDAAERDSGGEPVSPGFPLFHTVSLVQTAKYDPRRNLAELQEAVFGEKRTKFVIEELIGEEVQIKVAPEGTDEDEYGRRTRIKRFLKASV